MIDRVAKMLVDLKAAQTDNTYTRCPRCGRQSMDAPIQKNRESIQEPGVRICAFCSESENGLKKMNNPMPIESWSYFRPEPETNPYANTTAKDVLNDIVPMYIDRLKNVYMMWCDDRSNHNEYVYQAFESFPGLSEVWAKSSFYAIIKANDGAVHIRFRKTDDGVVEYAADIVCN